MIDAGVVPALSKLLEMDRKAIRREACWALSNIAAGSSQQVQALFVATPPVFPKVLEIVRTGTMDVRKEALWVVSNGLESCSWESILYLVDTLQVLRVLCELLSISDAAILSVALQCIHKLLKRAADKDQVARFVAVLADMNAIDAIENLQSHGKMEDMPDEGNTAALIDGTNHPIFDDNRRLIFCETIEQQLQAMQYFRKLLSVENKPIDEVIDAGLVPRFVQFLENDSQRELQFEAAWALTNIASGEDRYAATLVEHGVIPIFVRLMRTGDLRIVEQSAWGIGNMAGGNSEIRDLCLTEGAMPPLLEARQAQAVASVEIPEEAVDMILATGIASHLVLLLNGPASLAIKTAVLRSVGAILSGNEDQTQHMIDAGVIPALSKLLEMDRKAIRREACWALSNIAGGSGQQVQALFDTTPPVFPKVLEIIRTGTMDVRREALFVLINGLESCSWESILYLVDALQVLRVLCELLSINSAAVLTVVLQCIHKLLKRAADKDQVDRFIAVVADLNAIDAIENLQSHGSSEVHRYIVAIGRYFGRTIV
eukprot:gene23315-biopygen7318